MIYHFATIPQLKRRYNIMEHIAHQFIEAIKTIAEKPQNLDNLECYLSHHFPEWLAKFANTPETLTAELKAFAEMNI